MSRKTDILKLLFKPSSLAVIGASRNPSKVGNVILKNIIDSGYSGEIYPINPNATEISGIKCYSSLLEVPNNIDLGVVAVPADTVPKIAEDAGRKGVKTLAIISAGFRETGYEGVQLERRVINVCKEYGIRVLGPNCLGMMDSFTPLNASFAARAPPKGGIAFISQSGALITAVLDWSLKENMGFSKFISLGNMADINESDLMLYLADDEYTKVIMIYLEGITDGKYFLEASSKVTRKKPVIVLKSVTRAEQ